MHSPDSLWSVTEFFSACIQVFLDIVESVNLLMSQKGGLHSSLSIPFPASSDVPFRFIFFCLLL